MILERGRVIRLAGPHAWVARAGAAGCERCAAGEGCGGGLFARLTGRRLYEVRALDAVGNVAAGDEVVIGLPERALLAGAFAVYAVPLAGLLLGAALAGALFGVASDAGLLLAGGAGFLAGIVWLRRYARRAAADPRFEPRIVERITAGSRAVEAAGRRPDR
ncbi:MAG: SoxR reducing system RseC family protein [Gammaproteobacteria bacterium]|nr:SoxR reducing system RseC family protein [Gammaproteobacteria bacterium]